MVIKQGYGVAKTSFLIIFLCCLVACGGKKKTNAYAKKDVNAIEITLDSLKSVNTPEASKLIKSELLKMLKSSDEEVVSMVLNYYYLVDDNEEKTDSLRVKIINQFPLGITERNLEYLKVISANSVEEMKALYKKWKAKYPPQNFGVNYREGYNIIIYEIAKNYIDNDKEAEADLIMSEIVDEPKISITYYNLAGLFFNKGNLEKNQYYLSKSIESAKYWLKSNQLSGVSRQMIENITIDAYRFYAMSLLKEDKVEESIPYFEKVKAAIGFKDDEAILSYAKALDKIGETSKAIVEVEGLVRKDFGSIEEYKILKELYLKSNQTSTDTDFDLYKQGLEEFVAIKQLEKIKKSIINEKIDDLELLNINGDKVTLSSLKGKILILDFWATWCTPCKMSFPAMQKVKNKYKEDSDIKFLFVNTMEMSGDLVTLKSSIKDVLKAKKCEEFEVYLDEGHDGIYNLAKAFNVTAIPLKIIIGKNGNVRYRSIGYEGRCKCRRK